MISCGFVCILSAVVLFGIGDGRKLPSYIKPCRYHDPEINECMKNTFDQLRPKLAVGIPEMKVPSIDPFFIPEVSLDSGRGTATGLKAVFSNLVVEGGKDAQIEKFDLHLEDPSFKVDVIIPLLRTHSNYTLNGNILILQLRGHGHGFGNFSNIHAHLEFFGSFNTRKGKRYIDWNGKKTSITVSGGSFYFENLINGNKVLTESTNQVFNDNADAIIEEFIPLVEETVSSIVYDVLKKLFHLYSVNELFPSE